MAATGLPELAGLPNNVSGFARAIVKLRDTYAPNVVLGYHVSVWGTGTDIALSNPPDATIDALAARAATFYQSLAANFDIAFAEFSDRDAAFYQHVYGDGGAHWWDAEDFRRGARFLRGFSTGADKRIVMWQIPLGNTKMRAQNNTRATTRTTAPSGSWTSPRAPTWPPIAMPAWWRSCSAAARAAPPARATRRATASPIRRRSTATSSSRQPGTGAPSLVTSGGATLITPYAANDDGGYFRWRAWRYYQDGPMPFGAGHAAGGADQSPHHSIDRDR